MKHDKRAARFGEPYAATRPTTTVYLDVVPWSRHGCETFTDADLRRRNDRRRKGRAMRKQRRQALAALRMVSEMAEAMRKITTAFIRMASAVQRTAQEITRQWVDATRTVRQLTPDPSEAR